MAVVFTRQRSAMTVMPAPQTDAIRLPGALPRHWYVMMEMPALQTHVVLSPAALTYL